MIAFSLLGTKASVFVSPPQKESITAKLNATQDSLYVNYLDLKSLEANIVTENKIWLLVESYCYLPNTVMMNWRWTDLYFTYLSQEIMQNNCEIIYIGFDYVC